MNNVCLQVIQVLKQLHEHDFCNKYACLMLPFPYTHNLINKKIKTLY